MKRANLLFISYGLVDYDGRLRELLKISKEIGDTHYITKDVFLNSMHKKKANLIVFRRGYFEYFKFIIYTVLQAWKKRKIDILFVDNRKAVIPALILNMFVRPKYIIQDVRELYIASEVRHLAGKIGCYLEKIMIKKADVIISANKYRAEIMKKYYGLKVMPLIYENIRSLNYYKDNKKELNEKYKHYFEKTTIKIISTSGCLISRNNKKLVLSMIELGKDYDLFLVGGGSNSDIFAIERILVENKLNNVYIIGKLPIYELKYFIENCHIGIVNYHKKDTNNKYCASGKIYEYLFEGLPVVTTENIPLIDICNTYKIGVADDSYTKGIRMITENYDYYLNNVKKFNKKLSVEVNNRQLVSSIKSALDLNI